MKLRARTSLLGSLGWLAALWTTSGFAEAPHPQNLDHRLRKALQQAEVQPIDRGAPPSAELFELGQALFFDRILSGNRDISCATCHHPLLGTGDGLALPVGTGTTTPGAIGIDRLKGEEREFIPRNAPELFNRGASGWTSQFWDSRVAVRYNGFQSPAGEDLPAGILDNVLAVQAMFPVTSRDEMRGSPDDAAHGNEIAALPDDQLPQIWEALMERLRSFEEYQLLFLNAYGQTADELGFDSVAKAIAAFEAEAFGFDDSPFDQYLRGDDDALTDVQKQGGLLFYGKANCSSCHAGTLLTDQEHYNLGIPQMGPGKDPDTGLDFGRFTESGDPDDLFRFRTPPLRNVAVTGPWMHNGAYKTLSSAIRHHLDPSGSLQVYDANQELDQNDLVATVVADPGILPLRPDITKRHLNSGELEKLIAFLESLTAPNIATRLYETIPASVPSGLPVEPSID
ncbi:cytochrome-c peroxidase [Roseiconus nitratireducens]|uniref:Cytochrome-c peroxidase n=1 Tax=Roseiconus nitratireducens TaxID=2605748 RepID=A0A5M6CYN3_9BACT|nr:cytochrome c peroxidase [Roseiconus nitratireducens]KAA5537995.1 cytochrome-c peroxidase [Roseiconus nitratireducens]